MISIAIAILVISYLQIDWEKCKCYTIPVLKEWINEPGFTGKTTKHRVTCERCKQKYPHKW